MGGVWELLVAFGALVVTDRAHFDGVVYPFSYEPLCSYMFIQVPKSKVQESRNVPLHPLTGVKVRAADGLPFQLNPTWA